jgi:hypothetical protein
VEGLKSDIKQNNLSETENASIADYIHSCSLAAAVRPIPLCLHIITQRNARQGSGSQNKNSTHLTPTPLVKVGHQVVEIVDHGLVLLLAILDALLFVQRANAAACPLEKGVVSIH